MDDLHSRCRRSAPIGLFIVDYCGYKVREKRVERNSNDKCRWDFRKSPISNSIRVSSSFQVREGFDESSAHRQASFVTIYMLQVTVIKKHSESGPSKCVEANLRHFTSHLHRLIARRCRDLQESKETSSASKLQDFVFCPSFRLQKNQRPRPETPRRSSNNTTKNWDIREETLQGRSINAPALIRAHLDLYKEIMSYNAVLRPQLYTRNFPGYFTEYFPGDYETKRFISAFTRASPDFIDGKKQEGPSHVEL